MSGAKRLAVVPVLVLVACALLIVVARPFLREAIVEPLEYAVWLARLALAAVPQSVWWMLLVVIGSYVAMRALSRGVRLRRGRHRAPVTPPGPVQTWAKHIERASQGNYYRERLVHRLGRVTVAVLAHTRRAPADQIRRGLATGQLDVPQDIHTYTVPEARHLRASLRRRGLLGFKRHFVMPGPAVHTGPGLEHVIRFLESEMEVECGDEAA